MLEPHINDLELKSKIESLFEYRLFPELMAKGHRPEEENEIFRQKLLDLQTAIYHLDAHLEAHWMTNPNVLKWHWKNIVNNLGLFSVDIDMSNSYLSHIRKYEKHELELRAGKTPLRLDMEYFYFYKSCDVKLLRRLIYEEYKLSPLCGKLPDWRYYDLVTEVNDDVEDLYEDLDFINGNRFMIALLKLGKLKTKDIFKHFLMQINQKALEKFKSGSGSFNTEIYENTLIRVQETTDLVDIRLDSISESELKSSKLMGYLELFPLVK